MRYSLLHERDSIVQHLLGMHRDPQGQLDGPTGSLINALAYTVAACTTPMADPFPSWAEWEARYAYHGGYG